MGKSSACVTDSFVICIAGVVSYLLVSWALYHLSRILKREDLWGCSSFYPGGRACIRVFRRGGYLLLILPMVIAGACGLLGMDFFWSGWSRVDE